MSQDWRRLEAELRGRLTDWRGLLRKSVFDARDVLRTLLTSKIVFTPDGDSVGFRIECGVSSLFSRITALVAPTGFGSQASLFEIAFEGLALSA